AGKAYLPGITQALDMAEAATRGLIGRRERQGITISAPISLLNLWLGPRLQDFLRLRPAISVQLNSSIWTDPNIDLADVSFAFEKADLVDPDAVVLLRERLVLVAAGPHAERLVQPEALEHMPQIAIQGKYSLWDIWSDGMGLRRSPGLPLLRVDTAVTALELVVSGAGATVLYSTYAERFLDAGQLAAPLGQGVAVPHVLAMRRNAGRK